MKLLFDQNLSPRLSQTLADIYPDSVHIREVGLRDGDDAAIWAYAQLDDFVLVSKDSDFSSEVFYMVIRRSLFGCESATVRLR